jgi:hypothetical protein
MTMPALSCRFCHHANPAGAKFCNECGSPVHLKPCPRCDAVTDASAGACHQCGAPFDVEEPAPVVAALTTQAAGILDVVQRDDRGGKRDAAREREPVRHDVASMPPPAEATAEAPASSELTRIAEPAASAHIPEWLAERFDAANKGNARRGAAAPRANPADGEASRRVSGVRAADARRPHTIDALRPQPAAGAIAHDVQRPARRRWPLAVITLVVLAGTASYAYFAMRPALSGIATSPVAAERPNAATTPQAPPPRGAQASKNVPSTSPAAQPSSPLPGAQPTLTSKPPPTSGVQATPRVAQPLSKPQPPRAARRNATLAPRESVRAVAPAPPEHLSGARQRERDASETRRLIERDLGGFVAAPAR